MSSRKTSKTSKSDQWFIKEIAERDIVYNEADTLFINNGKKQTMAHNIKFSEEELKELFSLLDELNKDTNYETPVDCKDYPGKVNPKKRKRQDHINQDHVFTKPEPKKRKTLSLLCMGETLDGIDTIPKKLKQEQQIFGGFDMFNVYKQLVY